tara:strand:+ start:213 stop:512 length:300 start_codon:yes stop_codon:yes gene_type:complete
MVRKMEKGKRFYYIQSGNWEGITETDSRSEACSIILAEAIEKLQGDAQVSPKILSIDLSPMGDTGEGGSLKLHDSSEVLADAGLHGSASILKKIISNYE